MELGEFKVGDASRTTSSTASLSYPCSFDDPLNMMENFLQEPVPIVDVNQFSETQLWDQGWLGYTAAALRYSRGYGLPTGMETSDIFLKLLHYGYQASMDEHYLAQAKHFIRSLISYFLKGANIDLDPEFYQKLNNLPTPLQGDMMTLAEAFKAEGKAIGMTEGEARGAEKVALNLLKAGSDVDFVAKVTELSETQVLALKSQLSAELA